MITTTTTSATTPAFHVIAVHFSRTGGRPYLSPVWEAVIGAVLLAAVVIGSRRGSIAFYRRRAQR